MQGENIVCIKKVKQCGTYHWRVLDDNVGGNTTLTKLSGDHICPVSAFVLNVCDRGHWTASI